MSGCPQFESTGTFEEEGVHWIHIHGSMTSHRLSLDLASWEARILTPEQEQRISLQSVVRLAASYGDDVRWSADEPIPILSYSFTLFSREGPVLSWSCQEDRYDRFGPGMQGPVPFRALLDRLAQLRTWQFDLDLPQQPARAGTGQSVGEAKGCLWYLLGG